LLSASLYAYVAWQLRQRVVPSAEARFAWQLFVIWWLGLSITTFNGALLSLLGALELTILPLYVTITQLNLLFICVALWGLLYYLIYLFTGRSGALVPLSVFYVVYYGLLVYYVSASDPAGVRVGRWNTSLEYSNEISGPFFVLVLLLLVLPQIIGALAYFSLYFRVRDATQKYRILLVSCSLMIWFTATLAASLSGFARQDAWQLISRVIALSATLAIMIAYNPPGWIRRRYGIAAVGNEPRAS
jgi:hypothetical protein